MSQTEAARVFGVSLRAANKWVALDKDGGLRALSSSVAGAAPVKVGSTPREPSGFGR